MMLWDIIRDWFVQYIFGGYTSAGVVYQPTIGIGSNANGSNVSLNAYNLRVPLGFENIAGDTISYISIGDWLSTTATIITLVLLLIMLFALVRFVIRQVCGLFAKI